MEIRTVWQYEPTRITRNSREGGNPENVPWPSWPYPEHGRDARGTPLAGAGRSAGLEPGTPLAILMDGFLHRPTLWSARNFGRPYGRPSARSACRPQGRRYKTGAAATLRRP